jgi:hypothetical protein
MIPLWLLQLSELTGFGFDCRSLSFLAFVAFGQASIYRNILDRYFACTGLWLCPCLSLRDALAYSCATKISR